MAGKLYAKKTSGRDTHRGILWVAMIVVLMLLIIPILWMKYPFRRGVIKNLEKIPLQKKRIRVVVQGKIPKDITKNKSTATSGKIVVASITKITKGNNASQKLKKDRVVVNPLVDEEKAKLLKEKKEEKFKKSVSGEALNELEHRKTLILAKSETTGEKTDIPKTPQKGGMYSLIVPKKEKLKAKKPKSLEAKQLTTKPSQNIKKHSVSSGSKISQKVASTSHSVAYWVQVGAYSKRANALGTLRRVKSLGYASVMRKIHHAKYGILYLVRVPVYGSMKDAQKLASVLAKKLKEKPIVVKARR